MNVAECWQHEACLCPRGFIQAPNTVLLTNDQTLNPNPIGMWTSTAKVKRSLTRKFVSYACSQPNLHFGNLGALEFSEYLWDHPVTMKKQHQTLLYFVGIPLVSAFIFDALIFNLDFADEDFLDTGTWRWEIETELPVSIAACWDIVSTKESFNVWYPEVTNIEVFGTPGVDGGERFNFHDWVLNLGTFGSPRFEQLVDRFEFESTEVRTRSKWVSRSSHPRILTFTKWREQFVCEALNSTTTLLTRRAATDPGLFPRLIGFITRPRLTLIYEELCPARMLEGIANGDLPGNSNPQ